MPFFKKIAFSVTPYTQGCVVGNCQEKLIREVDRESTNWTTLCYKITAVLLCVPRVRSVAVSGTQEKCIYLIIDTGSSAFFILLNDSLLRSCLAWY